MTERIGLVPLDGSPTAEAVLPLAESLARSLGLRLVLVQMLAELGPARDPLTKATERAAQHYLDGVAASIRDESVHVETWVVSVDGDVAEKIATLAEDLDVWLILIGSHGRSGYRRWLLGSTADGVVRTSARPVLLVRANPRALSDRPAEVRRLLVPLDGSTRAEAVLPYAAELAAGAGARLDLVQVVPWAWMLFAAAWQEQLPEKLDEQLAQQATEYLRSLAAALPEAVSGTTHLLRGDPAEMILEHAQASGADLVAMTTHGRCGIARWALGSVADRIVHNSDLPVLLLRSVSMAER